MKNFKKVSLLICVLLMAWLLVACNTTPTGVPVTTAPTIAPTTASVPNTAPVTRTPTITPFVPRNTAMVATIEKTTAVSGTNSQYKVFVQPDDGAEPIIDFINDAKKTLEIKIYLATDNTVLSAIAAASKRGVKTRVLLEKDPVGEGPGNATNFKYFENVGAQVRWSSPDFKLTHEKSMVADDKAAIIMTMNLTRSSVSRNREYGIITTNVTEVKEIKTGFEADWERKKFNPPQNSNLVWSDNNARQKIEAFIDEAKKSLAIEQQYIIDRGVQDKLLQAAKRGVEVRVVVPVGNPGDDKGWATFLSQNGIDVRVLDSPYIHAKLFVADGSTVLVGSTNTSNQAIEENRELSIMVKDAVVTKRILETFEKDWKRARPF
jgi:phosphatidylserine/phosphatidylglycerophosphate/cardiolipin synthase-like enzyme